MGVVRKTLYNQMESTSRSTARKEWSYITDEDLDERVAEISLAHPFAGSTIILGHLEVTGLHVQKKRAGAIMSSDLRPHMLRCEAATNVTFYAGMRNSASGIRGRGLEGSTGAGTGAPTCYFSVKNATFCLG
ncbi:hypothetical protein DFH09DRAFT_1076768 [Mycena vulgaris]|nr:hypothetical protein DFH09DRAFT_1076768 [Mycena vulgaris]